MNEAIEQGRRGYTMKVHAGKTAFHMAYWLFLQERHPNLVMAKPGPKGPKSDWIRFKGTDFPKGVTLNHKNDQGCMDLEFERTSAQQVASRRSSNWPEGVRVLPRGRSAALSLPIPSCDMGKPLTDQIEAVETAFGAAHKLVPFAHIMQG